MVEHKKFLEGIWHELKNIYVHDFGPGVNAKTVDSVREDIEEHLGFFPCAECGERFPDDLLTGKKITHKATQTEPEEYENICEDCVALAEGE